MKFLLAPLIKGLVGGSLRNTLTNYLARLDGVTQYWQLSETIDLTTSDVIEFEFEGGEIDNGFASFIGTSNFAVRFDVDTTRSFLREQGVGATLNGTSVVSEVTPVPSSGSNKVSLLINSVGSLTQLGSIGGSRLLNLPLYNFKVIRDGVAIHNIPLTNKEQGAIQSPIVGNVSATMINYTEDVWVPDNKFRPDLGYDSGVAIMDGFSQYWQFSSPIEIPADKDFELNFKFSGTNDNYEGLIDSTDSNFWLRFLGEGQVNNLQGRIDGDFMTSSPYSVGALRDGLEREITIKRVAGYMFLGTDGLLRETGVINDGALNIHRLGRYLTVEFRGYLSEFSVYVDGVGSYVIPLTSKGQGAHQVPTEGTVGASMINYTEDIWGARNPQPLQDLPDPTENNSVTPGYVPDYFA